jgi:hypothetical protein
MNRASAHGVTSLWVVSTRLRDSKGPEHENKFRPVSFLDFCKKSRNTKKILITKFAISAIYAARSLSYIWKVYGW